jgi:hypothetical protein
MTDYIEPNLIEENPTRRKRMSEYVRGKAENLSNYLNRKSEKVQRYFNLTRSYSPEEIQRANRKESVRQFNARSSNRRAEEWQRAASAPGARSKSRFEPYGKGGFLTKKAIRKHIRTNKTNKTNKTSRIHRIRRKY